MHSNFYFYREIVELFLRGRRNMRVKAVDVREKERMCAERESNFVGEGKYRRHAGV